jgi:hypothetical protein
MFDFYKIEFLEIPMSGLGFTAVKKTGGNSFIPLQGRNSKVVYWKELKKNYRIKF